MNLVSSQLSLGHFDAARRSLEFVRREFPNSFGRYWVERWVAGAVGGLDSLAALAPAQAKLPLAITRAEASRIVANLAIAHGQLRRSVELGRTASLVEDSAKYRMDPVGNAAQQIVLSSGFRATEAAGVHQLDSLVAANVGKKLPVLDRPDLAIAASYAQLGRAEKAKAILADFERAATREERLTRWGDLQGARGELALAEGRTADAIVAFRTATYSDTGNVEPANWGRTDLRLARAFDKANQPDSALAHYEALRKPYEMILAAAANPAAIPIAARRLGELYEAKGDITNAIKNYEEFVKLWKDADPELQPQVADIKARVARLRAAEAKKR